jgi:hypothetical protein
MKKEIADKWIADLRSGPKQGRGYLQDMEGGYCCLGRLHVVLGLPVDNKNNTRRKYLSSEAVELAGMKPKNRTGRFDDDALVSLNDNGFTFDEIADIIEEKWEEL